MKKLIVGLAALCSTSIAAAQSTACLGKDPVTAAKTFYQKHAGFYQRNPKQYAGLLTPGFTAALQRHYDCMQREQGVCALDADPWTDAQDGNIYSPRFGIQTTVGELQATVSMDYMFKFNKKEKGKPQSVKLQLTRLDTKSCWQVNEFIGPDGAALTRTIRNGLASKK